MTFSHIFLSHKLFKKYTPTTPKTKLKFNVNKGFTETLFMLKRLIIECHCSKLRDLYKYIVFCVLIFVHIASHAQEGFGSELCADEGAAYKLPQDGNYMLKFPGTKGESDYLADNLSKKEFNSFWMRYRPKYNGLLEFEMKIKQEYRVDFYLFKKVKGASKTTLEFIKKGSTQGSGETGLSLIKSSIEMYEDPIEISPSNEYYILLNCFEVKKLKFDFKIKTNIDFAGLIKYNKIVDLTSSRDKPVIKVKLRDSETGRFVETLVQISGLKLDQNIYTGTDLMFHANGNQQIELECTAMGYFFQTKFIDPKGNDDLEIVLPMERLKIGKKLQLENIKFSRGSDEFLKIAFKTLVKLQKFMQENTDVRIEIQGHVNGPKMDNTKELIDLSEKRARAVMSYLVKNGINKERIAFRGMGNSEMIHKNPIFDEQAEENRRVEIMIIE